MIVGVDNNVISTVAADTLSNQTTIQVSAGDGAKFANLLTYDYQNASNSLDVYAKITLTDANRTTFEICHLLSVNGDILTVVRGQEGTTAKGWPLNSAIGNMPTRGTVNNFVQIEQLQSGHYISAVATGTANGLVINLPATYFENGSTDWTLRVPLVIYPAMNNTGASAIQLVMGGRVLGTFPLYKGNQQPLIAGDLTVNVGAICVMDATRTFFNVLNPANMYAGFVKKTGDTMTGPLTINTDIAGLSLRQKTASQALYLGGYDTGGEQAWIVGKTGGTDTIVLQNNKVGSVINMASNGAIILTPLSGRAIALDSITNVTGILSAKAGIAATGNITATGTITPENYINFDARYLTSSSGVQDIQMGAQVMDFTTQQAPAGCVVTFVDGGDDAIGIGYKPLQKKVNGVLVTISG